MIDKIYNNKRIKCVFLITGMMMGGAERVLSTLANEMVSKGHLVTLISLKPDESAYPLDPQINFIKANCSISGNNLFTQKIQLFKSFVKGIKVYKNVVKTKKPDIVLSFLTSTNLLAVICKKIFFNNIPLIISERADPCARKSKLQRKLIDYFYPQSDCIVCQGQKVANYFNGVNKKTRTEIIANPININCICRDLPMKRQKKIIAMGRLSIQKNYDLLIDSFYEFNNLNNEYELEIFGEGPEEERLKNKVKQLRMEKKIHFMGTAENVMKKFNDASLYVMSSNFEGFPNALLEAMASGLPVICTDFPTGTARDVIINGKNGYLIPMNDKKEMVKAMSLILNEPDNINKFACSAYEIYEKYNTTTIAEKWETLFFKLI